MKKSTNLCKLITKSKSTSIKKLRTLSKYLNLYPESSFFLMPSDKSEQAKPK